MAKQESFAYRMGEFKEKYGREGYEYYIHNQYDDRVISCCAIGTKGQVEATAQRSVNGMNERDNKARLQNVHQKTQTMKHYEPVGSKLRGLERA